MIRKFATIGTLIIIGLAVLSLALGACTSYGAPISQADLAQRASDDLGCLLAASADAALVAANPAVGALATGANVATVATAIAAGAPATSATLASCAKAFGNLHSDVAGAVAKTKGANK